MQAIETLSEYELERGKPMPSKNHAIVQTFLIVALSHYAEQYTIMSEVALDLAPRPLTPDVCVYPKLSLDWVHDEVKMSEPPLLVIEILSPKQYMSDLVEKMEIYFAAGVQSGWLVQPTLKSIAVFTPDMQPHVYTGGEVVDPATGITIKLSEIFR
jgi:Uma2 family endonuclease